MKVHISGLTAFHALNLAQEMARLGQLGKFYTGLPVSMPSGLASEQVCRQSLLLAPQYLALVLAQAMTCGLPMVATVNSGAEDLFSDGVKGVIIPLGNSTAIWEKIEYLYEHSEIREQMAQAALRSVKQFDRWDEYRLRAFQTYSTALATLRKSPPVS